LIKFPVHGGAIRDAGSVSWKENQTVREVVLPGPPVGILWTDGVWMDGGRKISIDADPAGTHSYPRWRHPSLARIEPERIAFHGERVIFIFSWQMTGLHPRGMFR